MPGQFIKGCQTNIDCMKKIRLSEIDTRAPGDVGKHHIKKEMKKVLAGLDELQNLLYAERKHSVLLVIQGMDAAGKDGLTRDVFTSMNPQGVDVTSFKEPTDEELSHDFLWRIHQHAPARGMIGVFNRSHYENVLITRVHNEIDDATALSRMKAMNDFERLLAEHNHTHILKFYLHISHTEQRKRLDERLSDPRKMYKYNQEDLIESEMWNKYMKCYEDVFEHCSEIPWHIIPSDDNWYKDYLVATTLQKLLKSLNMKFPGLKKSRK